MKKQASSIEEYLAGLPEDRRLAIAALRKVIKKNLDKQIEEGIQYGMLGYYVPHSVYPAGYHCDAKQPLPVASIGSQKNHIGLYLFCVYVDAETQAWFCEAWKKSGKKLDMGKSCVRVKKLEDIPLDVIGELFQRITAKDFIAIYESNLAQSGSKKASKKTKKKPAKKVTTKKKTGAKKKSSKKR